MSEAAAAQGSLNSVASVQDSTWRQRFHLHKRASPCNLSPEYSIGNGARRSNELRHSFSAISCIRSHYTPAHRRPPYILPIQYYRFSPPCSIRSIRSMICGEGARPACELTGGEGSLHRGTPSCSALARGGKGTSPFA